VKENTYKPEREIFMTINYEKHTIEMTKAFAKRASKYGTDEYKALQEVRRDNPTYRIVTIPHKAGKSDFKGLDYPFMKQYTEAHDDENKSKMAELLDFLAESEGAKANKLAAKSYPEIKKWFLNTFPEIKEYAANRNSILKAANERVEAKELSAA
jgi:hypothetical protein